MGSDFIERMPDGIKTLVWPRGFRVQRVLLNTIRVGVKRIRVPAVMERVQKKPALVVVINQFTAQHASAHQVRIVIERQKNNVKVLSRVTKVGFCVLGYRSAILGIALNEFLNLQHFPGERAGRLHAFKIRQLWRCN